MDRILERSLLYDFYGELLTEHQKKVYEEVVLEDLSLREVADTEGISRQGVHDIVKRCDKTLEEYENKLHLVERFVHIRNQVDELSGLISDLKDSPEKERMKLLSGQIIEEL